MSSSGGDGPSAPNSLIYGNSILSVISFCLTFLTLLRVIWSSLETLVIRSDEIHLLLANMKASLFEERELTRRAAHDVHRRNRQRAAGRRRHRSGRARSRHGGDDDDSSGDAALVDERAARVFAETVKVFCRRFRELEAPFLRPGVDDEKAAGREHFSGGREYGMAEFGGFQGDYAPLTLYRRFVWLRRRGKLVDLMDSLERLQVRRIGIEVAISTRYGAPMWTVFGAG